MTGTAATPSPAQLAVIRYFATGERPTVRTNEATYRVCRERDWIERIEEFPFHRATELGRTVIGL